MAKAVKVALRGQLLSAIGTGAMSVFMMASPQDQITSLETKRAELEAKSQAILDSLGEGVDLSDDQADQIADNATEIESVDKRIAALQSMLPKGQGRKTAPEPKDGTLPANGSAARVRPGNDASKHGFQSFGEFAQAVRQSQLPNAQGGDLVKKLQNAATTYGNEGTGADGGFLVPPEFSRAIYKKVMGEQNLLSRCAPLVIGGNAITIPKDETTPWQTTGGIQVTWQGEASSLTASKPLFEQSTLRLVKLTALVPISDELLEDSIGLESWLQAKAPDKMAAKINTAIINGNGVGQPLGILNCASVVTVSKEGSQTADTVNFPNVIKMYSRMYAPWVSNAIWLINQDILPQLFSMAFPNAAGTVPAYMPANSLANAPFGTLLGRPIVPVEACSGIGDLGDIIFVDLNQYWALTQAAGVRTDTSIHLYFDQSVTTFRFVFRMNGQPAWSTAITAQNGSSNARGWAIILEAR